MKFNFEPTQSDLDWIAASRRQSARDYFAARRPERLDGGNPFRGGKFAIGLAIMVAIARAAGRIILLPFRSRTGRLPKN